MKSRLYSDVQAGFLCFKNHRKYAKLCGRINRIKHGILYIIFIVVNT